MTQKLKHPKVPCFLIVLLLFLLPSMMGVVPAKADTAANKSIIVWDGDKFDDGAGWTAPTSDKITVKRQNKEAHNGEVSLEFHGEGTDWMGFGWNWHNWWPEDSGDDVTSFKYLVFWLKITGAAKPTQWTVSLNCSSTKKQSASIEVMKDNPDLADGKWHRVTIRLADLCADHPDFDIKKVWEIDMGEWCQDPVAFSAFVDEIGFSMVGDE